MTKLLRKQIERDPCEVMQRKIEQGGRRWGLYWGMREQAVWDVRAKVREAVAQ